MNYSYLYQTLKAQFSSGESTHSPDDCASVEISFEQFHSHILRDGFKPGLNNAFDIEFLEDNPNNNFSYPVINPLQGQKADNCIVMLHGLNERSWDKYLPWAHTLAIYTNRPVILFPIAYHMNRSPRSWGDPRMMRPYVRERYAKNPELSQLSVANVALSERLTNRPERFLLSGYQAANDLMDLSVAIKSGNHMLFNKHAKVDLFTYSIGTFLSQIVLLAHGDEYFADARIFNFCGGSTFMDMQGVSKYILDSQAFEKLKSYYDKDVVKDAKCNCYLFDILNNTALGEAFKSMLSIDKLRKRKVKYFSMIKDRLATVVLKKDTVMLPEKVKESLIGTTIEEWDFDYMYSHVKPFPLLPCKAVNQVNEAFDRLMVKAALHFTG